MASEIDDTAIVEENVSIGHFVVIMAHTRVGKNSKIGHGVVLYPDTDIGETVVIEDHAVVGKPPSRSNSMAALSDNALPAARIGARARIGVGSVVYRGSTIEEDVFIADYAAVREESLVGKKTVIGRGAAIENKVRIGRHCKIESGVFIAALSKIGDGCFIAPEVTVTNDRFLGRTPARAQHYKGITIEPGGRVGANATLLPGLTIQADGVAAAGCVLTSDVAARQIVVGNPARSLREVPPEQLLDNQ